MDEKEIQHAIAEWFHKCSSVEQVKDMQCTIESIVEIEAENRIYDMN